MERAHDIHAHDFSVMTRRGGTPLLYAADLTLAAGKLTAIVGPNGAGKSSLLRGIGGILSTSGSLRHGDQSLLDLRPAQRAKMLAIQPQGRPSADGLRADEYVAASLGAQVSWLSGVGKAESERVCAALAQCGAKTFGNRLLSTLSGGEAAKVALAATLVGGAPWLLLDEPASSLDPGAAQALRRFLKSLLKDGYSVAMIEHDLAAAMTFADHVVMIAKGEVVAHGTASEVLNEARLAEVYGAEMRFLDDGKGGFALAVDQIGAGHFGHLGGQA